MKGCSDHILKEELDTDTQNSSLCVENICFQSGGVFRLAQYSRPSGESKEKNLNKLELKCPS